MYYLREPSPLLLGNRSEYLRGDSPVLVASGCRRLGHYLALSIYLKAPVNVPSDSLTPHKLDFQGAPSLQRHRVVTLLPVFKELFRLSFGQGLRGSRLLRAELAEFDHKLSEIRTNSHLISKDC